METEYPTFAELKQFIKENKKTTICEIRDKYNQKGESIICINKPKCKNKLQVLAYGINSEFFKYLQTFMKEDYVICESDMLACRISDSTIYIGKGEFIPIVLSIKE
jgi:hypothetical protein